MKSSLKSTLLLILDGWGERGSAPDNATHCANTPFWDHLRTNFPWTTLSASGHDVGLPSDQMGHSEVGHLTIGAGRVPEQNLTQIDRCITNQMLADQTILTDAFSNIATHNRALHILGLLSDGGVHSHENHIHAILAFAQSRGIQKIYLHAFLDGRDTKPKCAETFLQSLERFIQKNITKSSPEERGVACQIASIIGRYYAMDRDHRWERTQPCYDMLCEGKAPFSFGSAIEGLKMAYERGETDEFVQPTLITSRDGNVVRIEEGDSVIFMNFRSDRARQLSDALTQSNFTAFKRKRRPNIVHFLTLTEYAKNFAAKVIFPPIQLTNTLGDYIAHLGFKQFRIAETEKYPHVTFFMNGGREEPFAGEDRVLIPSPKVATYDLKPEMSALEITDRLIEAITSKQYPLMICNYANADMVGHTGDFSAAVQAVETIDRSLEKVCHALEKMNGQALITADHGNIEMMRNLKSATTAHRSHRQSCASCLFW